MGRRVRWWVAGAVSVAALAALPAAEPVADRAAAPDDWAAVCSRPRVSCAILDPGHPPPTVAPGDIPRPGGFATGGVPGCVRGPRRPVLRTTAPSYAVTFTTAGGLDVQFEHQRLDGTDDWFGSTSPVTPGRPVVLEGVELQPGVTYRWRARGILDDAAWSPWCEYTVAAGLIDMRDVDDADALLELRVLPQRRYPVTLPVRQWRLLAESLTGGDDEAPTDDLPAEDADRLRRIDEAVRDHIEARPAGRRVTVTLTGNQWATAVYTLAEWAQINDAQAEEEPESGLSGTAYWTTVDRISAQLGGPAHPTLGFDR